MSAFDDEFGLFGEEVDEEDERRSTLGARKIASGETVIDEIEPEEEPPARRRTGTRRTSAEPERRPTSEPPHRRHRTTTQRAPIAREIAHPRAAHLLEFLAKSLVSKPEAVIVELHPDAKGAVLELEVDPDDLGKVIGRGGRVAQALRTLVRAGAEGRVTIDIVDAEEVDEEDDDVNDDVEAESGEDDL
jgi:predicted RNA-binding protein YlqC (UPF0109 family)